MQSYSQTDVFSSQEHKLLERAQAAVLVFPDEMDGKPLRCHEIARAIGAHLQLDVQDGKYGMVEHSWLYTTAHLEKCSILDPYCVGRLPQVQLVSILGVLPHLNTYIPLRKRVDIRSSVVSRLHALLIQHAV